MVSVFKLLVFLLFALAALAAVAAVLAGPLDAIAQAFVEVRAALP